MRSLIDALASRMQLSLKSSLNLWNLQCTDSAKTIKQSKDSVSWFLRSLDSCKMLCGPKKLQNSWQIVWMRNRRSWKEMNSEILLWLSSTGLASSIHPASILRWELLPSKCSRKYQNIYRLRRDWAMYYLTLPGFSIPCSKKAAMDSHNPELELKL